jgi:hypothetical protein
MKLNHSVQFRSEFKIIYMKQNNTTYVIDCGKNTSTMYNGKKYESLTHEEVLDLPSKLNAGDVIVTEYSHMGVPRTQRSLSQPFTATQLLNWYEELKNRGITLKLFPQKSTPSAINYSAKEIIEARNLDPEKFYKTEDLKSDETDPMAIYNYMREKKNISLMDPPSNFEPSDTRKEGWKRKSQCTELCNQARSFHYIDDNSNWIREKAKQIADNLSNEAKDCFGLMVNIDGLGEKTKDNIREQLGIDPNNLDDLERCCERGLLSSIRGISKNKEEKFLTCIRNKDIKEKDIVMPAIYAVLSTLRGRVLNDDGELSSELYFRESTGELPGWYFVKRYILSFSPFHLKGGTARSNIFHHSVKNWIKKKAEAEGVNLKGKQRGQFTAEEDEVFLKYRRIYMKSVKELFVAIKNILQS